MCKLLYTFSKMGTNNPLGIIKDCLSCFFKIHIELCFHLYVLQLVLFPGKWLTFKKIMNHLKKGVFWIIWISRKIQIFSGFFFTFLDFGFFLIYVYIFFNQSGFDKKYLKGIWKKNCFNDQILSPKDHCALCTNFGPNRQLCLKSLPIAFLDHSCG